MKRKKLSFSILIIGGVLLLTTAVLFRQSEKSNNPIEGGAGVLDDFIKTEKEGAKLTLDFGNGEVATYAGLPVSNQEMPEVLEELTAYGLLERISKTEGLPLEIKRYDFGILVEAIGEKKNTNEAAWIYFINGKPGETAADKQVVKNGDSVEWKYIKPVW